jgi:hypothetical protein
MVSQRMDRNVEAATTISRENSRPLMTLMRTPKGPLMIRYLWFLSCHFVLIFSQINIPASMIKMNNTMTTGPMTRRMRKRRRYGSITCSIPYSIVVP